MGSHWVGHALAAGAGGFWLVNEAAPVSPELALHALDSLVDLADCRGTDAEFDGADRPGTPLGRLIALAFGPWTDGATACEGPRVVEIGGMRLRFGPPSPEAQDAAAGPAGGDSKGDLIMGKTSIAWTEFSWNPVRGCTRISPGCTRCYAETMAARFCGPGQPYEGLAKRTPSGPRWTGEVRLIDERLEDPIRWQRPRLIFVNSMSDLFHEGLTNEQIDRVFAVMALAPQHTFQVLTKRPGRMHEYFSEDGFGRGGYIEGKAKRLLRERSGSDAPVLVGKTLQWPLPHVQLGTSVEDQLRADKRRAPMRDLAALGWHTWVSYEPALTAVDWNGWEFLRQIVVGGESGAEARPFNLDWARQTVAWCRAHGVAPFVKQMGSAPFDQPEGTPFPIAVKLTHRKGEDPAEWEAGLQVREFPEQRTGPEAMRRA